MGSREDKQADRPDSVNHDPILASRQMFAVLRALPSKVAVVALALLTVKFYEAAAELGTVEEFMESLSEIVIDENHAIG